jgi:hypothetical protein
VRKNFTGGKKKRVAHEEDEERKVHKELYSTNDDGGIIVPSL